MPVSAAPLLECVPNFSEGRNPQTIAAIASAIAGVEGVALLHTDISPSANRTVYTFAGAPAAVVEAAFQAISTAAALVDMRGQLGVHPRIGVADVCPLIPLRGLSVAQADVYARQLARRVGRDLGIPVYLYEHSQPQLHRRALPAIRKGQYEGLSRRMNSPGWEPDFGPAVFNAASGATVMGVRDILVAYNISLSGGTAADAQRIAGQLRTSGYRTSQHGVTVRQPGLLSFTRAIGWYMADYEQAQVSLNMLDYTKTSPLMAFEAVRSLATGMGLGIAGSEVIGLIPERCLLEAGSLALAKQGFPAATDTAQIVGAGIGYLMLNALKPFAPQEKILEYALSAAGL